MLWHIRWSHCLPCWCPIWELVQVHWRCEQQMEDFFPSVSPLCNATFQINKSVKKQRIVFFSHCLFLWKLETDRCPPSDCSLQMPAWGWVRLRASAWNAIQVSLSSGGDPAAGARACCPLGTHQQEADSLSRARTATTGTQMWDAHVPSRILTTKPRAHRSIAPLKMGKGKV